MLAEMIELLGQYEHFGAKGVGRLMPTQIGGTSKVDDLPRLWADGFVRRLGSAAGALEKLAFHQYPPSVIRHLFIELDGQPDKVPLFDVIADNEDNPEIVDEVIRAGARCLVRIPIGADLWRELTLHEYVINSDAAPECYCGNHSRRDGFASCTRSGFPRGEKRSALYCLSCLRYFKRDDGMVLGFVSRCTIERGRGIINCICGHRVALTKPGQRNLVSVDCLSCRRKIHCNSGLVIGWAAQHQSPGKKEDKR
jgi:hypothetical protein